MSEVSLVEYKDDPTLTNLQNAQARKFHYESECARISALQLIKQLSAGVLNG